VSFSRYLSTRLLRLEGYVVPRSLFVLILIAICLCVVVPSTYALVPPDSILAEQLRPEQDEPWRFTFTSNGNIWLWWSTEKDTAVTWDYGASLLMEIARGRGHRLWYGGAYRLAAGFNEGQNITPFDPSQVDTWMYFSYRWAWKERQMAFLYTRRTCFHAVDRRYSDAIFWTHAAFGVGTTSPAEVGENASVVRYKNEPMLNAYVSSGPFLHGGISRLFGHTPTWQWESSVYLSYVYPVTRTFLFDAQVRADWLSLLPNDGGRDRYRGTVRLYFIAQRDRGNISMFIDRVLHDDFPERFHPVAWRVGWEHRF
jgi:hypothetical protein